MNRSRYPALQIPNSVAGDLRSFLEGVKERLEITTGDRGDPRDRLLTVRDVEAAGMAQVTIKNKFATLSGGATTESVQSLLSAGEGDGDFTGVSVPTLDSLSADSVDDDVDFIVFDNAVARLQRVPYESLRELFLTESSDAEVDGNWVFTNEALAVEIRAEAPRLRLNEQAADAEVLPADSTLWDWLLDEQVLSLDLVADDEATTTTLAQFARDGLDPLYFALVNGTQLRVQDGLLSAPGVVFDNDDDTGAYRLGANRFGLVAGAVLALDVQGTQLGVPTGNATAPGVAFQGDADTGPFRPAANEYAISTGATERLRVNATGVQIAGTAVITALTGHLDVTPSAAANFAALKVRNNAGTEIWRLNSETDGDLDFARQSGAGLLRLNGVALIDATLFTTGTLDDARLSANVPLKNTANVFTAANTFNLTPTVPDGSWTYAKLQNVSATARVLGRITAGAGVIEELTGAQIATLITYTAADVLAKLLTVDGAGSLLDADFLDGMSSAAFAAASHTHAQADITGLVAALASKLDSSSYTAADVLTKVKTVDGSGSGLDADLLAGLSSVDFFRVANVLAAVDGTVGGPAYGFAAEASGLYRIGTNNLGISIGGVKALDITATQTLLGITALPAGLTSSFYLVTGRVGTGNATFASVALDGASQYQMIRFNSSYSSPADLLTGQTVGSLSFRTYDTTAAGILVAVSLQAITTDNWTSTTRGALLRINTAETGTPISSRTCDFLGQQCLMANGTAALPAFSYFNDPDSGWYRIASNNIGCSVNATNVLDISTALVAITATTVRLNTTTATTVGAAGAAAALPANPLGYISANIGGTAVKIPYYNN